jgi:hypothetical protein
MMDAAVGIALEGFAIGEFSRTAQGSILVFGSVMNTVVTPCSGCGCACDWRRRACRDGAEAAACPSPR